MPRCYADLRCGADNTMQPANAKFMRFLRSHRGRGGWCCSSGNSGSSSMEGRIYRSGLRMRTVFRSDEKSWS